MPRTPNQGKPRQLRFLELSLSSSSSSRCNSQVQPPIKLSIMRPLFRPIPSTLPKVIRRFYSSPLAGQSTPLITITDVPAPSSGRIRIISLARPSARNAISRQLLWELRSHIDAVAAEYDADGEEVPAPERFGGAAGVDKRGPTRALILASDVDSCFCAGADLKERAGFTPEEYVFRLLSG